MNFVFALLTSVTAVTALATLLAILMVIADATIANYGEIELTINQEKKMTVRGGKPLLSTLMGESVFIPSACGGRGSCGLCKVKVLSDVGAYLPTELPWISADERRENIHLSCQLKAKQDLEIQIPSELFNVKEFHTRVSRLRDLTHDIKEVTLQLSEPAEIALKAGQFVQFQVPEYGLNAESVYRAYSVASEPAAKNTIELEIRLVPDGICTTYVHRFLKQGDRVIVNGPYGDFFLRDSQHEIIFIAGGSGMAPIKAILYDMRTRQIKRKARYFFGALNLRDLFLVDQMRQLEKELYDFQFVPALSAPLPEDKWNGESGLITEIVDKHLKSGENIEAYLCGSPGMIDACIKVLTDKGVPPERIFFDKFA